MTGSVRHRRSPSRPTDDQLYTSCQKMKVAVVFLATLAAASAVRIENCGGSARVDLSKIKITGCGRQRRCIFIKGKDANMELPFTPNVQVTSLEAKVTGIIAFIPVPFKLPNPHACVNSGMQCPLPPNQLQTYTASLPVSSSYPSIPVTVKWQLVDPNGNQVVCIKFPVQLK